MADGKEVYKSYSKVWQYYKTKRFLVKPIGFGIEGFHLDKQNEKSEKSGFLIVEVYETVWVDTEAILLYQL